MTKERLSWSLTFAGILRASYPHFLTEMIELDFNERVLENHMTASTVESESDEEEEKDSVLRLASVGSRSDEGFGKSSALIIASLLPFPFPLISS